MNEDGKGPLAGSQDDLGLIERVMAGEKRAFEPLVRRHEGRVFRVALAILGNEEDAEEALQETFLRAFRHLRQFRGEARFSTWLTRIAVNESLERRARRREFLPLDHAEAGRELPAPRKFESWSDPEKLYGKREMRRIVEQAVQALPPLYRETLVLRDIEELTAEEAAGVLGIGVGALKSRLLRARLMLRETLAEHFEARPNFAKRMAHAAVDAGTAMAMRLMRAAGR